jgi:hypothetical protein
MFANKTIVVLIGNNGTLLLRRDKKSTTTEFVDNFSEENKPKIDSFFKGFSGYNIYILLDTIDQTYKKKTYPAMRSYDLDRIAKRDLSSDGDKEGLKNYIILKNKKPSSKKTVLKKVESGNKVDCLFITSSKSDNINNWLNYIYELPNRLIGIHMMPVECFSLFKKITNHNNNKSKEVLKIKENNIFCLVIQTRTGGARQIVFSNTSIVFTRVVNYNFDENGFAEKYSQDIYSTFEYLKRLYIDLTLQEFEVINIFPEKATEIILKNKNVELNISNYTVSNVIDIIKEKSLTVKSDFVDEIIATTFIDSIKILKFTNQKIKNNETYHFAKISSYVLNFLLFISFFLVGSLVFITNKSITEKIDKAQDLKIIALNQFAKVKKNSMQGNLQDSGKEISFERIGDFGRVEIGLGSMYHDFIKTYSLLKFIKNFELKFNFISYDLVDFNARISNNNNAVKQLKLIGKIENKTGDIENLFTEFDNLLVEMRKNLPDYEIKYNELPRNIDFNQKYFSFPVEFRIISKKNETRTN